MLLLPMFYGCKCNQCPWSKLEQSMVQNLEQSMVIHGTKLEQSMVIHGTKPLVLCMVIHGIKPLALSIVIHGTKLVPVSMVFDGAKLPLVLLSMVREYYHFLWYKTTTTDHGMRLIPEHVLIYDCIRSLPPFMVVDIL